MATMYSKDVFIIVIVSLTVFVSGTPMANIVFIVADDMGWDDVSFHGSMQTLTPNIDLLAYTGVSLHRHYSHCVCTPSRSALMTGKYAHTIGMHGYPLTNGEDRGLPLSEKLLPEYLKELGYSTHLIGKWHLGQSRKAYLPTSRGFDSHFGFRGSFVDYYEYVCEEKWTQGRVAGLDLYRNLTPAWDMEGYITDIFTEEAVRVIKQHNKTKPLFLMVAHSAPHAGNDGALLQAPPEDVRRMRHIESPNRRIFAAMMKKLDDSVGKIFEALAEERVLDNTIFVIITDNGGMPIGRFINFASNYPLRGTKFSPFEGGIRASGLMWMPMLMSTNHVWHGYMHIVDWLPTLLRAIGAEPPTNIDGVDLWREIVTDQPSKRQEFFEIYTYGDTSFSSIVSGNYKLVIGNVTSDYSGHYGEDWRGINTLLEPSYTSIIENSLVYQVLRDRNTLVDLNRIESDRDKMKVNANKVHSAFHYSGNAALYNIQEDPCEIHDLSHSHSDVLTRLLDRLQQELQRTRNRPFPLFRDPRSAPNLHNYTWTTWAENIVS